MRCNHVDRIARKKRGQRARFQCINCGRMTRWKKIRFPGGAR